ncbi:membrane protein required for colicin V production [Sphingomonas sp. OV641]|jgi:membrane protein required for colicin V production|uniref:CvpA family protein n=1 Tax=unclassified Sphingomonas TaxID=196159 RepID=UPI000829529F|nr:MULTISPECIES: CvpA family protein [unclassified Sphingomonas]SEJ33690.1 membrane protein required for colicin V production [Sphingomonas sp. OV641]
MNLNGLDIAVLTVVAGSALLGLKRGFVTEVLALFAWVAMIFAVKIFHLPLSKVLAGPIGTASGAAVLAFVLLCGVTYFLGRMVARALGDRVRKSVLGPVDRALGFGFGALKGLIIASLAFLLVVLVLDTIGGGPTRRPAWIKEARTYPLLNVTSNAIADFVDRRRRGQPVFGEGFSFGGGRPA